jgi:hypothetical protein
MRSEDLAEQLRRIGGIAAAAVIIAAALGTFALAKRLIPASAASSAPTAAVAAPAKARVTAVPAGVTAASAVGSGKGRDPLAAAQVQTEHALERSQHQELSIARRQAATVRRTLKGLVQRTSATSHPPTRGFVPRSSHGAAAKGESGKTAPKSTNPGASGLTQTSPSRGP